MQNFTTDRFMEQIQFSWYDYCLFSFMLGTSIAIGIYFGCFGKKQSTANEYLLGGKTMKVFPIAMSLIASHVSGITILSIPADVYKFGSNYAIAFVGIAINCLIVAYITMPVFHKLEITSTYEYLKMRFDTKTRLMASLLFNISMFLYLPIVIYGPALAFAQATPVNLHLINPIICGICIFYTTIGGLKAVVWTDTLQFSAMLGAIIAILCIGTSTVGGFATVFGRASAGRRLEIDFDINPTKRDTFWALLIGWTVNWIPHVAIGQGSVQKFLSLPNISDVRKTVLIFGIGIIFCKSASLLTGLIIYAKYYNCDPFTTKQIYKNDQLLPYFVMDVANKIPGLAGLFIAGVFCAALSTLSAQMNSLAGTIYEDFITKCVSKNITQKQVSNCLKLLVVIIGVVSTSLVFVVEHLGGILPLTISFSGVTSGPLLGLFTLGMVFPSANSKGALVGSITSLICVSWIVIGNQLYKATGVLNYTPKPLSASGCATNFTTFVNDKMVSNVEKEIFVLFRVTYYYYTLIGAFIVLVIGLPVSWFTKSKKPVDDKLITPWMRWAIPKSHNKDPPTYDDCAREKMIKLSEKL